MWSAKKANPLMSGLQSVVLGNTMSFDIEPGEFVQILHNGHGYWLTISTVGNMHPQAQVYDSTYSCCPTICKAQIAALLATVQPSIELQYMNMQMQSGSYDCALFAIAFATAIVFGKQPGLFLFDQSKMRQAPQEMSRAGKHHNVSSEANETGNKGQNH